MATGAVEPGALGNGSTKPALERPADPAPSRLPETAEPVAQPAGGIQCRGASPPRRNRWSRRAGSSVSRRRPPRPRQTEVGTNSAGRLAAVAAPVAAALVAADSVSSDDHARGQSIAAARLRAEQMLTSGREMREMTTYLRADRRTTRLGRLARLGLTAVGLFLILGLLTPGRAGAANYEVISASRGRRARTLDRCRSSCRDHASTGVSAADSSLATGSG
jgi:hypothetical protein